ncbi:MAG TPA: choice-of-anchor D domain-containing protein [Chryseosolibacter sp.]
MSNIATASTNTGPEIVVSAESLEMTIDAGVSTTATTSFDISNTKDGILRWESTVRHREATTAFNISAINYPKAASSGVRSKANVGRSTSYYTAPIRANVAQASFEPVEKRLCYFPTNLIGETNTTLSNSAAGKFLVTEPVGFNLTDVGMYLKHDPAKGPVIVEIYKGQSISKNNLLFAQEYTASSKQETWASIILGEQLYFEYGDTFWIVFHVPADNLFPLGIGFEAFDAASAQCMISFNVGATWQPLEEALNDKQFAFVMSAGSYNEHLGTYLTLDPSSGDISGNSQAPVSVTADASHLVNGNYSANIVLKSNDAAKTETRIPVVVTVAGHQPQVLHTDVADFGAVFIGETRTLAIELDNVGYGTLEDLSFSIDGDDYELISSPWSIAARHREEVQIQFTPTGAGNRNATLEFSNGDQTYSLSLFGVGAESSEIAIEPEQQSINDITIGDEVTANITIENTGVYPLKYFIPGFDTKGVSDNWPSTYHRYGYKQRSNRGTEANPIAFDYEDISGTGTDITSQLLRDEYYVEVDMGFTFPYYGKDMNKIYIAQKGFTTFDNTVRPINTPVLNSGYSPRGYISLLGTFLSFVSEGKVYYKLEPDRLIIQYDNVTDNFAGYITAQMVLHSNGDIRFYYEDIGYPEWAIPYLTVLIEDYDKADGILVNDIQQSGDLYSGLALGFDYPGPNIITEVIGGSGILAPGMSTDVEVRMNTSELAEGLVNRYINIVSNDPANKQKIALVELNIEHGGVAEASVSVDAIAFGDVFQGSTVSKRFAIKNTGTASLGITSIAFANDAFTFTGNAPAVIKPALIENYVVVMPTTTVGLLEDVLTITYADGSSTTLTVTGNVVDPPAIAVDLTLVNTSVDYGEKTSLPLTIQNPGLADLTFTTVGKAWMYTESSEVPTSYSYSVQKENTGGVYQWIDIRKTGTQLPFATDPGDVNQYWRDLTLPFDFTYFGRTYSKLKIGENGIVSFEEEPPMMDLHDSIPSKVYEGAYIMPYWSFAGFDTYNFKKEDVGIFYQSFDDRIIIMWSYLVSRFSGMGDPVSAQLILYTNGAMRFQYKAEEGRMDDISRNSIIGLQEAIGKGFAISDKLDLDWGKGLAYNILPSNQYVVAPGATWNGSLVLDATHTYGGSYASPLQIHSNVPGSELLEKPVELTINGVTALSTPTSVDFGSKIIAVEDFMPVMYTEALEVSNSGTTPIAISWIESASGSNAPLSIQVYALIDGWAGPQWEWVDVSYLFSPSNSSSPVYELMPGDDLLVRAAFVPTQPGDASDEFVFTTSAGEKRITLHGSGIEAPSLQIEKDPVNVFLNTSGETSVRTIALNNMEGKSPLTYEVSVQFDRGAAQGANESVLPTQRLSGLQQAMSSATSSSGKALSLYNRTLKHTERQTPDNHVGTGGSAPFTVATRFNAGNKGFNLSHIETWFRAESFKSGTIEVEVRAGSSVTEAVTLASAMIPFERSGEDQNGNWMQLPLESPVFIYPNEDFYILITYPFEIKFPQGIVRNEPTIPGRYLYSENGQWADIQNEEGFVTAGWLMYAAEQTEQTESWVSIQTSGDGSIPVGEAGEISLLFNAALASAGDQFATVVVSSNDPTQKQVTIPVTLHLNRAPVFTNVPEELEMFEADTLTINIAVDDVEQNSISAMLEGTHEFAVSTFENGIFRMTFTPGYETAGSHTFNIVAKDEHGAVAQSAFSLLVKHTNRPPLFIGATDKLALDMSDTFYPFSIKDYFADPDHDPFSFEVVSSDVSVAEVFRSGDGFLLNTKAAEDGIITITAVDIHGAKTRKELQLTISENANQPPVYVGPTEGIYVSASKQIHEFDVSDFFADPDNDAFTYAATSTDNSLAQVFTSANKFLVHVLEAGTLEITFTVTDTKGASVQKSVPLHIEVVLSAEAPLTQGIKVFPNPASDRLTIALGAEWKAEKQIELVSMSGKLHVSEYTNENELTLELKNLKAGVYVLRVASRDKIVKRRIVIY